MVLASHPGQVADPIHSPPCPSRTSGPRPNVGNGTLMICHRLPVQCNSAAAGSLQHQSRTATQGPCALGTTQAVQICAAVGPMLAGSRIGFCQRPVQCSSTTRLPGAGWRTRPTTQMFRGPANAASNAVTGAVTGLQSRPLKCSAYTLGPEASTGPSNVPNAQASERLNTQAEFTSRPSANRNARHRCPLRSSAKLCSSSATDRASALFTNVQEYDADRAATAVPYHSWLGPENSFGGESSRQVRPSQCAISRPGLSLLHGNRNSWPVVQASRAPVAVTDLAPAGWQAPKYFTTRQPGDALTCPPAAPAAGNAAAMRNAKPVTAEARRMLTIRMISTPSRAVNYHRGQTGIVAALGCEASHPRSLRPFL